MKFKTLSSDAVFKNIFFKDKELFKWLINRTLKNTDYYLDNIEFLNCELTKDRIYIKSKMVDILTINKGNDILFNIELNPHFDEAIMKRNYVYQCAQIVNLVHVNKDYSKYLKPIIQINYNFKSFLKDEKDIHNYTDMEKNIYKEYGFFKEIINIDIDNYIDKWYNLNKDRDYYEKYKHFLLIGMSREDLEELEDDDEMVKKIKDEVLKLNNESGFYQFLTDEEDTEILCNSYYSKGVDEGIEKGIEKGLEQGLEQGIEQGLEQGIEQGVVQNNLNNARKMKQHHLSFDLISQITGLDYNTISSL